MKLIQIKDYLLLIDGETEIKDGDICIDSTGIIFKHENHFPISIGQRKITAYHPLTKDAKELDLSLLPNPILIDFNELEWSDIADEDWKNRGGDGKRANFLYKQGYVHGAYKALQSKQFSLEDMIRFAKFYIIKRVIPYELDVISGKITDEQKIQMLKNDVDYDWSELVQEYIQSLSIQQLPKEFVPEYDIVHTDHTPNGFEKLLKFKTNSEGKKEIQGTYKF